MKKFFYLSMMLLMASGIYAQEATVEKTEMSSRHSSLSGKLGDVTRADIMKTPVVTVDGANCKVTEFKMSITGKDAEYKEFEGKGSKLDNKMLAAIKSAPPHAKLMFEYIKYSDESGKTFVTRPFVIVLK